MRTERDGGIGADAGTSGEASRPRVRPRPLPAPSRLPEGAEERPDPVGEGPGESVRFRLLPWPEGASLLLARFVSFSYVPHRHETFALGQTLRGLQDFRCRGERHRGSPGSLIALNPDEVHDGRGGLDSGFAYRMLYLPPSFVAETARDLWGDPRAEGFFSGALHRDPASVAATGRLFRALSGPSASPLEVRSELTGALAFLLRHCGERRGDPPPLVPRVRIVQDAMAYLRENPSATLTLAELAERFDDSPVAFLRRFRRTAGIPLHRFRIQCRVERARRLIAEGMPLAEVAQETGFCDQSHLNRRFRAICGLTPGAYEAAVRSARG